MADELIELKKTVKQILNISSGKVASEYSMDSIRNLCFVALDNIKHIEVIHTELFETIQIKDKCVYCNYLQVYKINYNKALEYGTRFKVVCKKCKTKHELRLLIE